MWRHTKKMHRGQWVGWDLSENIHTALSDHVIPSSPADVGVCCFTKKAKPPTQFTRPIVHYYITSCVGNSLYHPLLIPLSYVNAPGLESKDRIGEYWQNCMRTILKLLCFCRTAYFLTICPLALLISLIASITADALLTYTFQNLLWPLVCSWPQ